MAFCECCRRLLFTGFYCNQCNFRFHQRCAEKVPVLCHQIPLDSYIQHLLSQNTDSKVGLMHLGVGDNSSSYRDRRPRTLNQQDRSNSAPNVCINSVKPLQMTEQQKFLLSRVPLHPLASQEYSHSTQASPTNTLKHVKRPRARSADESNKNLLSPREVRVNDENWVRHFN